jgi:CBS domain containing-hemolysin-like protein
MTERDMLAANENGSDKLIAGARPSLFDRLRALFGLGGASIRDDIQDALADTSTDVDFSAQERAMLKNVLALHELRVEDVMVPRADIMAVALETSLSDVLATFRTAGHSRLPVHGETLDDPRGMVHIRDFVSYLAAEANPSPGPSASEFLAQDSSTSESSAREPESAPAARRFVNLDKLDIPLSQANILRPVLFVPPSMPALDLLLKMQATRTHMALVIDEYGGTDGLASIEDIVEMIVGDIEDEHDFDESPKIDAMPDGSFVVDARASLEDVSIAIDSDLATISDAEDVDTLGGLITTLAGHVPVRGEIIVEGGLEFEVLDADPRRVKRIKIHIGRGEPKDEPAAAEIDQAQREK